MRLKVIGCWLLWMFVALAQAREQESLSDVLPAKSPSVREAPQSLSPNPPALSPHPPEVGNTTSGNAGLTTTPAPAKLSPEQLPAIAPLGVSPEIEQIQSYLGELDATIKSEEELQRNSSALTGARSEDANHSNARLQQLKTVRLQVMYDLSKANERAAITARAAYHRDNLRSAYDYTHSGQAISSPVRALQSSRNERTGIPIRMMDSLPGPQDPNDLLNTAADGTSSLHTFQLVPFWRTPAGNASLSYTDPRTLSTSAVGLESSFGQPTNEQVIGPQFFDPNPSPVRAAKATADTKSIHSLDFGFQLRPGMYFDTGFLSQDAKIFTPANIALNHSTQSHQNSQLFFNSAGQTGVNGFLVPFRPQIGYNRADLGSGSIAVNADLISTTGNDLDLRTGVLRYLDTTEEYGMSFGKMETLFGDLGTAAGTTITGALPVGTVSTSGMPTSNTSGQLAGGYTGVSQLRLMRYWHNVHLAGDIAELSFSIEDQTAISPMFLYSPTSDKEKIELLHRYPTMVSRLRYGGSNGFDSLQIAGLLSPIGFDSKNPVNNFHEAFDTAWGISTNARFELGNNCLRDTLYLGAVGGSGIGGYIYGNLPGAVLSSIKTELVDDIKLVTSIGAYASYRHVLAVSENGSSWSTNWMGGIAQASNSLDSTALKLNNRQLAQIGTNLLWQNTSGSLIGLEYQYGSRLVQDGSLPDNYGEDHRLAFVLQFSPAAGTLTPAGGRSMAARTSMARSATADDFNSAAGDARSSKKSRMRF